MHSIRVTPQMSKEAYQILDQIESTLINTNNTDHEFIESAKQLNALLKSLKITMCDITDKAELSNVRRRISHINNIIEQKNTTLNKLKEGLVVQMKKINLSRSAHTSYRKMSQIGRS